MAVQKFRASIYIYMEYVDKETNMRSVGFMPNRRVRAMTSGEAATITRLGN